MIEIVISGQRVFQGNDIDLRITKSIYEIFEPDKRKSDFTKTVELVGTKEVDQLFLSLFDVNIRVGGATFDPSVKADAIIYSESIEQMRGYVQLTDIVITNENEHIYKVVFYGNVRNLFAKLEGKKLNEIDISEYDHTYNDTNIANSWETSTVINEVPTAFEMGVGYVYPMVFNGVPLNGLVETEAWTPWLFVKTIWDKIFDSVGERYDSHFLNSSTFKGLIYSSETANLWTEQDIIDSIAHARRATSVQQFGNLFQRVNFNADVSDPLNQWDTTNSRFEADISSYYNINGNLIMRISNGTGGTIFIGDINVQCYVRVFEISTGITQQLIPFNATLNLPNILAGQQSDPFNVSFSVNTRNPQPSAPFLLTPGFGVEVLFGNIYFQPSNQSFFPILIGSGVTVDIQIDSAIEITKHPIITAGNRLQMSRYLGEMQQKDFIMGIAKMFNLYFETQEDGSILIEPRDDYYTSDVEDVTDILDVKEEFVIKPLEQAKYKRYNYKYADGKDLYNAQYRERFGKNYGDIEVEIENEFAKETKEIKIPFSVPVLASSQISLTTKSPRPVSSLLNKAGDYKYDGGEPYIMIYGGMQGTLSQFTFGGNTYGTNTIGYPFAGHLNNTGAPDRDLLFGFPETLYYRREGSSIIAYPEFIGLFWQYHYRDIFETTNRNSKIIECSWKIDAARYPKLSFRKAYFMRNAYYRLYEIKGYDPNETHLTRVVLLKIDELPKPIVTARPIYGGGDTMKMNPGDATIGDRAVRNLTGDDNFISDFAGESVVMGTNNTVGDVSNVLIQGSDNIVLGDNVTVLNMDNKEITASGVTAIGFNAVNINTDYTMTGNEGSPLYFFLTGSSSVLTLSPIGVSEGQTVYVRNNSGVNWDVVSAELDFSETVGNNQLLMLYCTGTQWKILFKG
jgi:hypothetical protein